MSVESVMPSNHLILCHPLLLLPSIFPSISVLSNESVLRIRWPKYWSFSFSISPTNEYSGLISFKLVGESGIKRRWKRTLQVFLRLLQETLGSLDLCQWPQVASQGASENSGILWCWEEPLGTPLSLVQWKRASSLVAAKIKKEIVPPVGQAPQPSGSKAW